MFSTLFVFFFENALDLFIKTRYTVCMMKMKNNLVTVIYPDEYSVSFDITTDSDVKPTDILEMVFGQWNYGSGVESELFIASKKRSLSVNDIVSLNGTFYLCESFGWKEVTAEFVNDLERDVACHPSRFNEGAWYALQDVMFRKKPVFCGQVIA